MHQNLGICLELAMSDSMELLAVERIYFVVTMAFVSFGFWINILFNFCHEH